MMDLSKATGEKWKPFGNGEESSLPLFKGEELKKAELIIKALDGMSISSAKELLNKIPIAMEQLTII